MRRLCLLVVVASLWCDGAPVRLRGKVHRQKSTLVIDLGKEGPTGVVGEPGATIVMEGAGPAIRIVGTHRGTAQPESLTAAVKERERAPRIEGIAIVGAHPLADGLQIEGAMEPTVTGVLLQGLRHGIVLTGRNRNVTVSDVNVYDNAGAGILLDRLNLHQVNIANSHISYNRGGGIVVRASEVRNLQIANCDIEANMAVGGAPTANIWLDARNGSIREGAITGCTLQHDGKAKGSANIRFTGAGAAQPEKVGYFSITGNHLSDADLNIHLQFARGVNITGNTFGLGFSHNLLVESSSHITLGANTMDQNPDYDQPDFYNRVEFRDSAAATIQGLHIARSPAPEAALVIRRSRLFNVWGVTIVDGASHGVLLEEVESSVLGGCLIDGVKRERVVVKGGARNRIACN